MIAYQGLEKLSGFGSYDEVSYLANFGPENDRIGAQAKTQNSTAVVHTILNIS